MRWEESTVGERIVHMCKVRGISVFELAQRAGIAHGPIYKLSKRKERLTTASVITMTKLAKAADVSLEWLVGGEGPMERQKPRLVRDNTDWPLLVEEARRSFGSVPERYFEEIGDSLDTGRTLTWLYVGRSAQLLMETDIEAAAKARGASTT